MWVCLCVCQHDNFRTSKHRMMKLGGLVHCTKISAELEFGGQSLMKFCVDCNHKNCHVGTYLTIQSHSPGGATVPAWAQSLQPAVTRVLQHVACGYDVGKISAGCLLYTDARILHYVLALGFAHSGGLDDQPLVETQHTRPKSYKGYYCYYS